MLVRQTHHYRSMAQTRGTRVEKVPNTNIDTLRVPLPPLVNSSQCVMAMTFMIVRFGAEKSQSTHTRQVTCTSVRLGSNARWPHLLLTSYPPPGVREQHAEWGDSRGIHLSRIPSATNSRMSCGVGLVGNSPPKTVALVKRQLDACCRSGNSQQFYS